MVSFRRHALITPLLLSSAALTAGACANAPEEPTDDLATAQQALDPVCVTLRRGAAGDVGDTFLSGDYPTWAPGTDWGVWTGVSSGGNFNQALYSFDISAIPPGATVTSATFTVYQSWSASYNQVGIHRITGPWSEATASTSQLRPAFIQGTPDVSFAAGGVGFRSVDVAPIVQEWVSGDAPNHGIALVEPPVNRHYFFTSEISTVSRRPSLTVCYNEAACEDGVQSAGEVGVDCGGPCPACECTPDSEASCYTGPAGTEGVGACAAGSQTCNAEGSDYGACTGDVTPVAEDCSTAADDDCDGEANEGCLCVPGSNAACYTGPIETVGVGACAAGLMTCDATGSAYGPCTGEILPATESCATAADDDCDGVANEGCVCATRAPGLLLHRPRRNARPRPLRRRDPHLQRGRHRVGRVLRPGPPGHGVLRHRRRRRLRRPDERGLRLHAFLHPVLLLRPRRHPGSRHLRRRQPHLQRDRNRVGRLHRPGGPRHRDLQQRHRRRLRRHDERELRGRHVRPLFGELGRRQRRRGHLRPVQDRLVRHHHPDQRQNSPVCAAMSGGRTLRTNLSTEDPTIWVSRGNALCTSAKITYSYYQFAYAAINVQYQRSNDANEVCEKTGTFTTLATPLTTQACVTQSHTVTFNRNSSIYFRFEHGTGTNAMWLDNVSVELQGCSCN